MRVWTGEQVIQDIFFFRPRVSIIESTGWRHYPNLYWLFCLVAFTYFSIGLASCKQSINHVSDLVLTGGWYISSNVHNIVASVLFQIPCLRFLVFKTLKDAVILFGPITSFSCVCLLNTWYIKINLCLQTSQWLLPMRDNCSYVRGIPLVFLTHMKNCHDYTMCVSSCGWAEELRDV